MTLAPASPQELFSSTCAKLLTTLLDCHVQAQLGHFWQARDDYHTTALRQLMTLLRLENGNRERWTPLEPADGIEAALDVRRLKDLRDCLPAPEDSDLSRAFFRAGQLGADVARGLHEVHGWPWPSALAQELLDELASEEQMERIPGVLLRPVGYVENSIDDLLPPGQIKSVPSRIVVFAEYGAGLEGLTADQRLLVVFQFHYFDDFDLRQHPKNDPTLPKRGVFALHSPRRPNPIGVTEVELVKREGNILHVRGLDAVNGTPVLDLKLNE